MEGAAGTGGGVAAATAAACEMPDLLFFFFVSELARVVEEGCEESPGLRCLQQGGGSFQRSFLGLGPCFYSLVAYFPQTEMDKVAAALTDNNR